MGVMASGGGTTRLSFLERLRDVADTRSWASFHKQYGDLLLNYAGRLGASRETAEDVVQEVEMYLFKAMNGFHHQERKGCFRAYLRSAVVHALARKARQQRDRETALDPRAFELLAKTDDLQDAVWQHEHYLHRIRWAMRQIANEFEPVTLEAFHLHVMADESASQTAQKLGISRDSVYQAKSRVLRRLRERIAELDSDVRI